MMDRIAMDWKNALKFSGLFSLLWSLIVFLGYTGILNEQIEIGLTVPDMFKDLGIQVIAAFSLFFSLFSFQFSTINKKWKINRKTWVLIAGSISIVFAFVALITALFVLMKETHHKIPNVFFILVFAIIISAITILLTFLLYFIKERAKTIIENQQLLIENMRARYETLKSQINPHFLFNSLNTLNGLIGTDDNKAKEFVEQLSFVFRYSIQNKEVTTLDNELMCIKAFCSLMKIRYGESLFILYRLDERYQSHLIIPLSLQTLVENAIKHNIISRRHPLTITIETTHHGTVRVWNRIQPKHEDTTGEGIGLANMIERYKILYQKEVVISDTNGIFDVELPLIEDKV